LQIENSFEVGAPPDRVYAFLLDVNRVVGCVPGAELSEVVDPNTFKGKVKIKVGPVTVAYAGTARISGRDEASRTATLEGEGRETTGPGNARAKANMKVEESGAGSRVTVSTDFTVAGRVAQFGRGLMEDVSKSLVAQMAACIKSQLETAKQPPAEAVAGADPSSADPPSSAPKPVNALGLLWTVFVARIRSLFSREAQPR
jgi:carbon monoxide dehydrogenase subunit G